jgi:hypothetical protein
MGESDDRYPALAAVRVNQLQGEDRPEAYVDFLLETSPRVQVNLQGKSAEVDAPELAGLQQGLYVAHTPGVQVTPGKRIFLCRSKARDAITLLSDATVAQSYRGASWSELIDHRYEFIGLVLEVEAKRRTIAGGFSNWRGKLAEVQPGDVLGACYPPVVFAGDGSDALLSLEELAEVTPIPPADDGVADSVDPNQYAYFLMDGFGVELTGQSHIELPGGLQWWPATRFPNDKVVLNPTNIGIPNAENRTFTGVLLVRGPQTLTTMDAVHDAHAKAQTAVKRLRTLLNVRHGARVTLLGDFLKVTVPGSGYPQQQSWYYPHYRFSSVTTPVRRTLFPSSVLTAATAFSFAQHGTNSLGGCAQRALDSLDLARSALDLAVSHVLTWAAVEAILSPSDKSELISNITLCLLGLQPDGIDRSAFWERSKASYEVRSRIVHSFKLPSHSELLAAVRFAEEQCELLLRTAIAACQGSPTSRDAFSKELRTKALA